MLPCFDDITSRLGEPKWYYLQGVGVPRYYDFNPGECGVYDCVAALSLIGCQACRETFKVVVCFDNFRQQSNVITFPTQSYEGSFGWADPPIHGCVGDTMTSETVKILEFWKKESSANVWKEWVRKPEYEFSYESVLE